ncbi:50S ribosomal protein L11 methyltransferase [Candidatus Curtissbacteria bacterium]|nr:50S ribosomal protein L11 methyltransferase [Candidatus Curtissbacteria bacterium]
MLILTGFLILVTLLLALFLIVAVAMVLFDLVLELPYVATDRKKIETIIKFSEIKPGQTVVDLGSGDGRLLIASAKLGAKAVGYELNPFLILITKIRARLLSSSRKRGSGFSIGSRMTGKVIVYKSNLWKADLKVADIIFVYSLRRDIKKFEDFIFQNAKNGTKIIANTNEFPSKKPIESENGIFLYKV